MKNDYSNREIDLMMKLMDEKLDLILKEATKHNGRLSRMERWMWTLTGAIAIVSFLLTNNLIKSI